MKKIVIFTSTGGGGHLSASKALQEYLTDTYLVYSANIFKDVLKPFDFIRHFTFGKYSGEDLYNKLIFAQQFWLLGKLLLFGNWYINALLQKKITLFLSHYLAIHKPDLVISVVPLINSSILQAAENNAIPFLLVPADMDVTTYLTKINHPTYNTFFITVPFDDPMIMQPLLDAGIQREKITVTGALLRPDFLEQKDTKQIKKEYNLPDKPIVMTLMGRMGSNNSVKLIRSLSTIDKPIHLLVCIGMNSNMKKQINCVRLPEHISLSVIDFTQHISDLMAVTDFLITKPGPTSVCEALYTNTFQLLDATGTIPWERFNLGFVQRHKLGEVIYSYDQACSIISSLLTDKDQFLYYKRNIEHFKKKDGGEEIKEKITQILKEE